MSAKFTHHTYNDSWTCFYVHAVAGVSFTGQAWHPKKHVAERKAKKKAMKNARKNKQAFGV
jgi:hypothetical protein